MEKCPFCGERKVEKGTDRYVEHRANHTNGGRCRGSGLTYSEAFALKTVNMDPNRLLLEEGHFRGVGAELQNLLVDILGRLDRLEEHKDDVAPHYHGEIGNYISAQALRDGLRALFAEEEHNGDSSSDGGT